MPVHHPSLPSYPRSHPDDRDSGPGFPDRSRQGRAAYRPYPEPQPRRSVNASGPYGAPPPPPPPSHHYPPAHNPYSSSNRPMNGSPLITSTLMHGPSAIGADYGHHSSATGSVGGPHNGQGSSYQQPHEMDSLTRSPALPPMNWPPSNTRESSRSTPHRV